MASSSITTIRLMKEKKKMDLNPSDTFLALPTNQNIFQWHFVLFNFANDSPFKGGQFHGIINFPTDYPLRPPAIQFVTPNGRFAVGVNICLSFTNYHPETWNYSWTIESMLIGLVSFMHTSEKTAGDVACNNNQKLEYAKKSIKHNLDNPQFVELFAPHFDKLGIRQNKIQDTLQQQSAIKVNLLELKLKEQTSLNANQKNINFYNNKNEEDKNNNQNNVNNVNNDNNQNNVNNDNNKNSDNKNNYDNNNTNIYSNNIIYNNTNIYINDNIQGITNIYNNNSNYAARQSKGLIIILLAVLLLICYVILVLI